MVCQLISESKDESLADTSYTSNQRSLHDASDSASNSDASTLITRPAAAYTSSPFVFERNPVVMPGPLEELTPPPSPGSGSQSPGKLCKGHKPSTSLNLNFNPLLNHASTVISPKRSSVNSSPTRSVAASTPGKTPSTASSESPNRLSKGFADFFQVSGNSAPVSFGLLPTTSPKKEQAPVGSPFTPRPGSDESSSASSPVRPGHVRRESTLSAAASFLGLSAPRATSLSPVRKSARSRSRLDDAVMRLDFENEIFPDDCLGGKGEKAFDELLANAEKLFERMRDAYSQKLEALSDVEELRKADKEALDEQTTRAKNLKLQLDEVAAMLSEKDAEVERVRHELEERERRARIRVLPTEDEERSQSRDSSQMQRIWSVSGENVFEVGDDEDSNCETESVVYQPSRPISASSIPTERPRLQSPCGEHSRRSVARDDVAPFLPPEERLQAENKTLQRRVQELEETLQGCLGLVE